MARQPRPKQAQESIASAPFVAFSSRLFRLGSKGISKRNQIRLQNVAPIWVGGEPTVGSSASWKVGDTLGCLIVSGDPGASSHTQAGRSDLKDMLSGIGGSV